MGCWGITAFESDTGLDAIGVISKNLPEDGNLKLGVLIEVMKTNQWSLPDISNAESHSGAMALAEIMVKFMDGDISELDKRFCDVLSFTTDKESVRWIRDYLLNTHHYKTKEAEHGNNWGGWFKEQDWIAWQNHMKSLVDSMNALFEFPEDQIELIQLRGQTNDQGTAEDELEPVFSVVFMNKNKEAMIDLPTSEYHIIEFSYKHQCDTFNINDNTGSVGYQLQIDNYNNIDATNCNLHELNYLAIRVADFDDYQKESFDAYIKSQDIVTIKQLINAAHNINDIMWHPVGNDTELGEFALDNELLEEYNDLPDNVYEALDRAKAGAKYREQDGGKFVDGGYLVTNKFNEVYDGITLPDSEPLSPFQIHIHNEDGSKAAWLDLPASEETLLKIVSDYGVDKLYDIYLNDLNTTIPYIKKNCEMGMDDFDELNALAKAVQKMGQADIRKFKAVLEIEQPYFIKDAFDLCGNLNQYNLYSHLTDPNDYGKMVVCEKLGIDYDDTIIQFIDNTEFGAELMRRNGIIPTQYGGVIVPQAVDETMSDEIDTEQDAATDDESEDQEFEGVQMT